MGQEPASELKHAIVPQPNGGRGVSMAALYIERGVEYPTAVKLSGNVEIKTPVCAPAPKKGANMVCDGYLVVRADEALFHFHEDTGQIEAHGNVTVTPLRHKY
jgi:uncharacterized protein YdeI (BOF family)